MDRVKTSSSAAQRKVIMITNDLEIGGVQRLLIDLVRTIDRERFSCSIALVCAGGPLAAEIGSLGIEVREFHCIRRTRWFKWLDPLSIYRLSHWIRADEFCVCHTHLFLGNMIGRIAAWLAGCKVIISTEHNTYIHKSYFRRYIDRILASLNVTIVAVTQAVAEFTSQQEHILGPKFSVIYNGIDTDYFSAAVNETHRQRHNLGIPENHVIIGSVGRLVPQKDFGLLLDCFELFQNAFPDSTLVIVGDGPERSKLLETIREKGLTTRVIFTGFQHDIRPYLAIFDIFLTTPLYEGLGLVLLEAMMAGVPVVASRVGGIPEVIEHGTTGFLVETRDPHDYVRSMSAILNNEAMRKMMIEQARQRVRRTFSLQQMVAEYQKLYEKFVR